METARLICKAFTKELTRKERKTYLNAIIIWPFELTGFAFSRYAVKLSSRQRMSASLEFGGLDCLESSVKCEADATILHIGQPALGANSAIYSIKHKRKRYTIGPGICRRIYHRIKPLRQVSNLLIFVNKEPS
jgi:hypothetical protein